MHDSDFRPTSVGSLVRTKPLEVPRTKFAPHDLEKGPRRSAADFERVEIDGAAGREPLYRARDRGRLGARRYEVQPEIDILPAPTTVDTPTVISQGRSTTCASLTALASTTASTQPGSWVALRFEARRRPVARDNL